MRRKFIQDISANTLQVLINQFFGLVIFYELSLHFSKSDFGEINWSLAVLLAVFSILSLGIDQVIIRKIAAKENPELLLSSYFLHVLASGFFFYAFLLFTYYIFPGLYFNHYLLLFLGTGKLMIFFSSPFKQFANGTEKFRSLLFMSTCSNVIRGTALILFAIFNTLTFTSVIIIFISGDASELLLSLFITKKKFKIPLSVKWNKFFYMNLLKESIPQAGVVIFTSAIARFDWILLGILASNMVLAEYSFAFRVFEVASLPLLIIAPLLIPRFTRLFHSSEKVAQRKVADLIVLVKFEIVIASFISLILGILWIPVIDFITEGKYGSSNYLTILILSASMPLIYFNNFLWTINFTAGRLKMIFYILFFTFLINVLVNIILIPFFGGAGAAIAYLLSMISQFLFFWVKTDLPELKKRKNFLLFCPLAALASESLSCLAFKNTIAILLTSISLFFLLLLFARFLQRCEWLRFRIITGF